MPYRLSLAATLLIALAIGWFTLRPIVVIEVGGSDKLHHLVAFGLLTLPLSVTRPRWIPWVLLAAVAYGAAIEIIQPYVGRFREWADLLADAAGALIGAAAGLALSRDWSAMRRRR
ncbi:hypothetical protein GCM10011360_20490 [Primorskyibacter flagellatus]|uniref:VanZ-like domain-containing protein n=1 Tax=Primorskyibacter flagellatus TaxID=1387277 RepID=A0A917A774_9RHOB|nr:VanZ family protein [Primorskyibacter flagellatus]GGE32537.1 hypothetical protein GCM10011360_20490 [Primorskyibacter flagellatus]